MFLILSLIVFPILCNSARFPYIIGGEDVDPPGKWPFMVSQQYMFNGVEEHSCGASLISTEWLVTAAHCVDDFNENEIFAILGAHDIQTREVGDPTRINIQEIILHPEWEVGRWCFPNDIAVLKLTEPADVTSDYISIVPMADADTDGDFIGKNCYIIGWGLFEFPRGSPPVSPNILQEAEMTVISNQECEQAWENIHPSQICVSEGEKSACSNDSGGPLVCEVDGEWTLVGATSAGAGCPVIKPSIYTRISYYRDWIREITGI